MVGQDSANSQVVPPTGDFVADFRLPSLIWEWPHLAASSQPPGFDYNGWYRPKWTLKASTWAKLPASGDGMGQILIYVGSLLILVWGTAHLFPTRSVVAGFGSISEDNKNIILMEWMVEGVALIFAAVLVASVTIIDPTNMISIAAYIVTAVFLAVMAIVSLFTGFKIRFLPFRLCPAVFASSAALISSGWLIM